MEKGEIVTDSLHNHPVIISQVGELVCRVINVRGDEYLLPVSEIIEHAAPNKAE